jgi:nicotinamide-nucleotide amidase
MLVDDPLLSDDARGLIADLTVRKQSVATAGALAVGARQRCDATWGVGLTGVAGPDPHGGHEVGTVFMGLAGPVDTEVIELKFTGTRWDIRISAVRESISRLRALVAAE